MSITTGVVATQPTGTVLGPGAFLLLGPGTLDESLDHGAHMELVHIVVEDADDIGRAWGPEARQDLIDCARDLLTRNTRADDLIGQIDETHFTVFLDGARPGTGRILAKRLIEQAALRADRMVWPLQITADVLVAGIDTDPEDIFPHASRAVSAARSERDPFD